MAPVCRGKPAHGVRVGKQRGVVLFFALIVLVILLIGGVIVVRSTNASLFGAGNLAFRRDLVTQSDTVVAQAIHAVATAGSGAGDSIADLKTSQPSLNYSAVILPVNAQSIPDALLTNSDSAFSKVGSANNDIKVPNAGGFVVTRYVIERMCNQSGAVTSDNCVQSLGSAGSGGTAGPTPPPAAPGGAVYRLSARVTGPRGTQAFFQTMFNGPA
jgi:hypothetical protein